MPKKHLENDFEEAGPSPQKSSKQDSDSDGNENGAMEVAHTKEEIGSLSENFLKVIWEGNSIETIYDSFMDNIIRDPVLLDSYQQLGMVNIVFKAKPDFPFPNIAWIVKKRFSSMEKCVKDMLMQLQAPFIIHLSLVFYDQQQFILVELSYLSQKKQLKIILLACVIYQDEFLVQRQVYEVISTFEIRDKCFLVCGKTEELNPTVTYVKRKIFWDRNNIAEYFSTDGKLTQENVDNLKYSLITCIELVKSIEENCVDRNKPNQQQIFINNLIEDIELDSLNLEIEMREIYRVPEVVRYYSTNKVEADLLCVKALRKMRESVNDIKINLEILFETLRQQQNNREVIEEDVGFKMALLNVNKECSYVRWRKVLESCSMLIKDYCELQKWATSCLHENSNTKTMSKFNKFVIKLTPTIEVSLWTQVFLIQCWMNTDGIPIEVSNNHSSASNS